MPARSTIESSFLMLWTRAPDGFEGVSEIDFANEEVRIQDRRLGKMIRLRASRGSSAAWFVQWAESG
ncbi:MAG: hypothetical protein O2968_11175 [Acidobacteria bacterium]|nr:hypothetical protein [Acidobacteriota bacterium]